MVGHRHLEVVWSRDQPFTPWEAALAGLSWLSKLTEGSTSPPANSVVLPGFLHGRLPWLPSPHACLACMHSRWSHALICLNMTSEVVLLYRNDEHISSHIDEGQFIWQPYVDPTIMVCIPKSVLQCRTFWGAVVPLIHFGVVEYQCGDKVLRQFNYHQPIPRPSPACQHIHSTHRGRFDENWIVKQANFILVWEERHTRWTEDLSPLQASDIEFNTDYYSWYLENGKPFLVSVEVGNKWREDPRCSKHRQLMSEFGQSFEEPTDEPNFEGWPSSWNSVEDSSIHVSNNPWEQPSFGYVSEQPPMYGGSSSSQHAYTDDGGYIPQIDYTSITGSSFHPEQMHGTPPSMQMDDQWFNDEQTPDPP
ncbi:hypothetical protein V6N12_019432 [Hibiscus sabdariffa]|uniref:Aminotransferase-like plant mobile domain-containing protein n=1 Tax=Hibiscus sabdariffa TaxID=183260 RepID=A0ABR2BMN0_9ROSI